MFKQIMKAKLPKLSQLVMGQNPIGDAAVDALIQANLTNLTDLSVDSTFISNVGFRQIVNKLSLLSSLVFARNNITSAALQGCHSRLFRSLKSLRLDNNVLDDQFLKDLLELQPSLDNLKVLGLNFNDISDSGMELLCKMKLPRLVHLLLKGTNLTTKGLVTFSKLSISSLQTFYIDLENVDPKVLEEIHTKVKFQIL